MSTSHIDYSKIMAYIQAHPLAVLGTLGEDGAPYGSVVYVCTGAHGYVYFITKTDTQKYRSLQERPYVSLTILDESTMSTLQAQGTASTIHDAQTIDTVMKEITRAHTKSPEWLPPIAKLHAGQYVMVGIELNKARLAEFGGAKIGDHASIFTEV